VLVAGGSGDGSVGVVLIQNGDCRGMGESSGQPTQLELMGTLVRPVPKLS